MYELYDFTIVALKKCIEVDKYTVSAPDVYSAIEIAENHLKTNNTIYDEVVSE